jgi:hypothetical protein
VKPKKVFKNNRIDENGSRKEVSLLTEYIDNSKDNENDFLLPTP